MIPFLTKLNSADGVLAPGSKQARPIIAIGSKPLTCGALRLVSEKFGVGDLRQALARQRLETEIEIDV